jgi:cobalamin biosynthesis protein CobW
MSTAEKIPTTIVTGFLGAGKTTLVRHVLSHARGRRIAVMVNEFGSLGIDGDLLRSCGIEGCDDDSVVELANGCLCCTVADDFVPAMEKLLDRPVPPEHILIETSGLAIPKPLLKAFSWPAIRSRVTVDGVITVLDGPAVAAGRFADDPTAVAAQRAADISVEHDNPLAEVYEDQILSADLILINKSDLLDTDSLSTLRGSVSRATPRAVKIVVTRDGIIDPTVLLGLRAAAEDDLAARPSHHDAADGAHEHDDFDSFVVDIPELDTPDTLLARMRGAAEAHDILRMKGFVAIRGKAMRAVVQGVGSRIVSHFDRPWSPGEDRAGHLVVIGQTGMDRAAIGAALRG